MRHCQGGVRRRLRARLGQVPARAALARAPRPRGRRAGPDEGDFLRTSTSSVSRSYASTRSAHTSRTRRERIPRPKTGGNERTLTERGASKGREKVTGFSGPGDEHGDAGRGSVKGGTLLHLYRGPDNEGLAGRCFQAQEVAYVADVAADPGFARRADLPGHYDAASALAAPIPGRMGVAVFYNRVDPGCYAGGADPYKPLPLDLRATEVRRASLERRESLRRASLDVEANRRDSLASDSESDDLGDEPPDDRGPPARRAPASVHCAAGQHRRKSSIVGAVAGYARDPRGELNDARRPPRDGRRASRDPPGFDGPRPRGQTGRTGRRRIVSRESDLDPSFGRGPRSDPDPRRSGRLSHARGRAARTTSRRRRSCD